MTPLASQSIFSRLPESYNEHPDLLKWVKADTCGPLGRIMEIIDHGQVLDVGCGAGILGRLLSDNHHIVVDGIDPAISPDNSGLRHYRRFDQCTLEDILDDNRICSYDWFVFADVIEHMPFPDVNLRALVQKASPNARYIISTPNVAHNSVRFGLLNGSFSYSKSGILESTHLRFLTFETLTEVLNSSNLKIDKILCLNREHYPEALDGVPLRRALAAIYAMQDSGFPMTYQFLAICSPGSAKPGPVEVIGNASKGWLVRQYLQRRYGKTPIGRIL